MKRITEIFVNIIIKLFEIFSNIINDGFRSRIALFGGWAIFCISRERKAITIENLKFAFPNKSINWINEVTKKSFQNIAVTFFELLAQRKFKKENVSNLIRYKNIELITDAFNRGKGVILLSGHFGNWELLALSAGLFTGIPVLVVVQKQRYWDSEITEARTKFGNQVVERGSAARKLVSTLKGNGVVAMLADQSPPLKDSVEVEFFGHPTLTYKAPSELALKFGSAIITGFAIREKDYTYSVVLEEIPHEDLEYNDAGIKELTQRYSSLLERRITKYPHLWAWQHKRWKNIPEMYK